MNLSSLSYQGAENDDAPAILMIEHEKASAAVAEVGATLTAWQPAGEKAVLFTSPEAQFEAGKAVRGGVPLCWPWFGPHRSDESLPQHGLLRTREWRLVDGEESDDQVTLRFEPVDDEGLPEGVSVAYEIRIGETLELTLTTDNQSGAPFRLSQALHAYFAIGDLTVARVFGLENAALDDVLSGYSRRKQRGVLDLEDAIDSIFYPKGQEIILEDPAWQRKIHLEWTGSQSLVVWNPGKQGAEQVSDLRAEDYRNFICLEPSNALQNDQTLADGARHQLNVRIRVESQ